MEVWACTVTGFNTEVLFLFVHVPGGLLLSQRLNCPKLHLGSKKVQDASQVLLLGQVVAQE